MSTFFNHEFSLDIIVPAYNAAKTLPRLLASIENHDKDGVELSVIVVDDASSDDTPQLIKKINSESFNFIAVRNDSNIGRAQSCNAALKHASGMFVLFLDADCYFKRTDALQLFKRSSTNKNVISFGTLSDEGGDFWSYFFNKAQNKKVEGKPQLFSSTNMLVSREFFDSAGGFPVDYRHYGFEDRDLICRLSRLPGVRFKYLKDATLIHHTEETVETYCTKFFMSGKHSSQVFCKNHPIDYAGSIYYKFDYTKQRWRKVPLAMLHVLYPVIFKLANWRVNHADPRSLLTQRIVQLCAALSFWQGTRQHALQSS